MNIRETAPRITELEKISTRTDTRDYLAKAASTREKLKDWLIVDVDAHVTETAFMSEINSRIDNEVLRYISEAFQERGNAGRNALFRTGRSTRTSPAASRTSRSWRSRRRPASIARCSSASAPWTPWASTTWWCSRLPMLSLGMHPQIDAEVALGNAYNRWMVEKILPEDKRQMALLYLPFNDPDASVKVVEEFADKPGVVGFTIASTRHKPVWHNSYMRLYGALQECGKPLGVPRRVQLERPVVPAAQPLHRHALALVRALQHGASHQLGAQRAARALPQAQGDLDRERASPGSRSSCSGSTPST